MLNHPRLGASGAQTEKATVVALHCSGAGAFEWRPLTKLLDERFHVAAPDLIGCGTTAHWSGVHAFGAADEAALVMDIIDEQERPVHLVGHSYGGAIALRVASERPDRIASLTLYEPMALHLLKAAGPAGQAALDEITAVARALDHAVLCGAYWAAAERFVDYWSGAGAWAATDPDAQARIARYIPKACLEFRALAEESTARTAYRKFDFPKLLLVGEHTREPARLIARQLARVTTPTSLRTVFGAGHMGPFTHATIVNTMIANHIMRADPLTEAMGISAADRLAA
jgi:pimeloyl-ACP methyl ester carboxylesterase